MGLGIPQVVAMVGAASLLLAATVAVASLPLVWWASDDPPGKGISSPDGADVTNQIWSYEITLWGMTVESRTDEQDGSLTYSTGSASWGEGCDNPDSRLFKEVPNWCGQINLIRACVFLSILFALVGVGVFMYALMKQILLLLVGGAFATVTAIFALAATMFCIMQRNSDLASGPLLMIVTVLLAGVGVMISIYGAAQAAEDIEEALKESRAVGTRQKRADVARQQKEEEFYATKREEEIWRRKAEEEDSDDGSLPESHSGEKPKKEVGREAPKMLMQILEWSQENEDDEDAKIPRSWLHVAFQQIDQDHSGVIDIGELVDALQLCGLNVSQEASELIMQEFDSNCDGKIQRHEFIEFFRRVEDLNRFQKRKERRAQFATFVMNCCFLSDIIIVAVLVMAVINMERSGGGSEDDRVILTNLLYATGLLLGFLFCMVVAWPALRLTLSPSINAWEKFYGAELEKRRKRKRMESEEKERMNESKPSLKHSAISATGEVAPVPVNATVMGASYRVNKVQAIMDSTQGSAQALADSQAARRSSLRASLSQPGGPMALPDIDAGDGSTTLEGLSQPGQVMDMDEDLAETLDRYSYARHHYSSIQAPKSYQPFQLQLPEVVKKDAEDLGHRDRKIAALTDGSYTFQDSRG